MTFSPSALRLGAWIGLFSSGAAVGVLVEKKGGPSQYIKGRKKTKSELSLTPIESQEGKN